MIKKLAMAIIALTAASSLHAASVTINNYSFENGANLPANPGWNNNVPDGWTASGSQGLQISDPIPSGIDGLVVVFLEGGNGSIKQDITAAILGNSVGIGDVFTLTLAARNANASPTFDFDIQDSLGTSLIGGAQTSDPLTGTFSDIVVGGTIDTASTEIFLYIETNGPQVQVDNVRLDLVQVPEPSSAALLGLGGLALILRRRK